MINKRSIDLIIYKKNIYIMSKTKSHKIDFHFFDIKLAFIKQ